MEPIVEKITLVEDARFDSPKSMFMGRVMGKHFTYCSSEHSWLEVCSWSYLLCFTACVFSFRGW